jgi:hypothetical protein
MSERLKTQKDNLAKLMAGENLTIVHRKTPTAYFDLKNRLLCCPIFKDDISSELYDLFMGHEVGHALWTPYEGVHSAVTKNKTLKGYLNVVEDVRIEKNIRNKYQGLRKSFFTAYNELMEMDFFGVKERDINKECSLIDKINLITKCGSRIQIKLSKEEQFFLDWAERCETWDEVEECATAIYEWSKTNETRTEADEKLVPQMFDIGDEEDEDFDDEDGESMEEISWGESEESDEDEDGSKGDGNESDEEDSLPDVDESEDSSSGDEEGKESDEEAEEGEDKKSTGGKSDNMPERAEDFDDEDGARESITEHNAHNNEEQFISDTNLVRTQIDLKKKGFNDHADKTVIPYKTFFNDFRTYFVDHKYDEGGDLQPWTVDRIPQQILRAQHSMKKMERKNKAIVNHMAKEFEMRQSAMLSKHAFSGKTGKLDMNRLAKYQIVEDVFKRVTYMPEGENHGVNIMIDWSGSINKEVRDLLEQSIILTMFCRKVNIPHRVYLFSDRFNDSWGGDGNLIEIFSNEMNTKDYKEAFKNVMFIWNSYFSDSVTRWGRHFEKNLAVWNEWFDGCEYVDPAQGGYIDLPDEYYPQKYGLGGTPLDTTLVAMRKILPEFNKRYAVEKSILTVITDGYSHTAHILEPDSEEQAEIKEQCDGESWNFKKERELIDPISGRVYPYEASKRSYFGKTQNLLHWLSEETGVIVTGYFVCGRKGDMSSLLYEVRNDVGYLDTTAEWKKARKEGAVYKVHGYNKLFLTASSAIGTDGAESLDDELIGAKKSTLTARFKKNQNAKSTSRFLTNEFIKEIA